MYITISDHLPGWPGVLEAATEKSPEADHKTYFIKSVTDICNARATSKFCSPDVMGRKLMHLRNGQHTNY